jgi:hypothetical protein
MNYQTQEEHDHFEGAMEQSVPSKEEQEVKPSSGDEVKYKCNKCKDKIGAVICPCEVAPKYDADYEEWRNK